MLSFLMKKMQKQIRKSLQECISKFKIIRKQIRFQACSHIRTASLAVRGRESDAATLSDIDQFLFENFQSLYQEERRNETKAYLLDSPMTLKPPPPENLRPSDRFFVASGSSSRLLVGETRSSAAYATKEFRSAESEGGVEKDSKYLDDFLVLLRQSRAPYEDFRQSMEAMVEAHIEQHGKVDWEYLEELLRCYMDLNSKYSHKYVVQAFVDLVQSLRENSHRIPAYRPPPPPPPPQNDRRGGKV
ncbi:transcription repressor OFP14 [Andrographis paniculata]|uniref:transcription repressor OFP14 n=1 Tax=Andrographis paniculata TaxID=175694 RepID=UPI0021E760F7|nr:transcription repressor OFP14 [Andrographis paniculata]